MINKLIATILVFTTLIMTNVTAEEVNISPALLCEQNMDKCTAKCDETAENAQRDACLEKCELAYNKCYEEAESK